MRNLVDTVSTYEWAHKPEVGAHAALSRHPKRKRARHGKDGDDNQYQPKRWERKHCRARRNKAENVPHNHAEKTYDRDVFEFGCEVESIVDATLDLDCTTHDTETKIKSRVKQYYSATTMPGTQTLKLVLLQQQARKPTQRCNARNVK